MTKGENDFEELGVAFKSKGGDVGILTQVWHYDIGFVLDGNSLR